MVTHDAIFEIIQSTFDLCFLHTQRNNGKVIQKLSFGEISVLSFSFI